MMIDSQLSFTPLSSNQSLVGGAGVNFPSTNIIDVLGQGAGTAPANIIGTPSSGLFGADMGVSGQPLSIEIIVGTAFTTSDACTLNVAFQGAPDLGTPTYQPGTYQTYDETGPLTAAQLTANQIIRLYFPVAFPASARPRFLRLLYQVPSGLLFTAGTIASAFITPVRDDLSNRYAANNYRVA